MIRLTRLNNQSFMVNSDLIKFVERSPDTLITLLTGEKIVVRENPQEVLDRVITFRRSVLEGLPQAWDGSATHNMTAKPAEADKREPRK